MFHRIAVAVALFSAASGCMNTRFAWFDSTDDVVQQAEDHRAGKLAAPNTEVALRVDRTARKLLSGSPFLFSAEPTIQTIGVQHPELFHKDAGALFITEGVVSLCQSEDELAAVLATELGTMCAEMRRAERMKLPEPIPAEAHGPTLPGGPDADPARLIQLADMEMHYRKPAERRLLATTDPKKIAADILKDAGYDEKVLKQVEPILRKARLEPRLAKQLAGNEEQRNWLR